MRDLYRLVVEVFHKPGYVVWYVFCMILVGIHLSHGFASSFQSLGIGHPRYTPIIKGIGWIYSIFVALGFLVLPLYVYFLKG
jgi:succinate dehydrogenase / fumarate reductase cytochrome b subunit